MRVFFLLFVLKNIFLFLVVYNWTKLNLHYILIVTRWHLSSPPTRILQTVRVTKYNGKTQQVANSTFYNYHELKFIRWLLSWLSIFSAIKDRRLLIQVFSKPEVELFKLEACASQWIASRSTTMFSMFSNSNKNLDKTCIKFMPPPLLPP